MKKRVFLIIGIILFVVLAGFFIASIFNEKRELFTKTSLLRMNIPLGGEFETYVKITNPKNSEEKFNVYLSDLSDLTEFNNSVFYLDPGKSENVKIIFKDKRNEPGIYIGRFIIETIDKKEEVPIILGIEDSNHAFAIIKTTVPKYDHVYPGGKLGIDIRVYDLIGSSIQTVNAVYQIKNFNDEILFTGESNLVVGGGSKTELISIPSNWEKGNYILITSINYKGTMSFGSYQFSIGSKENETFFDNFKFWIILLFIIFILIIGAFFYFIKTRDELLLQLKKQQSSEFKRNMVFIEHSREKIKKTEPLTKAKKEKLIKIENARKKVIKKLREKQKKQIKEIKKLTKSKKPDIVKKKIEQWKKQGYNMVETEDEIKRIDDKNIKFHLNEWKKKGYDTSFLNK